MRSLKINRLLPIYISIVPLKFGVDIQSQSKARVWKPKNPIWPPGGHFKSDVAENQQASVYGHCQHAYEIWNWNSKANLSYAPETGGHFKSDVAKNQQASVYGHYQHACEIWNWNSKANLSYAPETMSSTDRRTDGQTDSVLRAFWSAMVAAKKG